MSGHLDRGSRVRYDVERGVCEDGKLDYFEESKKFYCLLVVVSIFREYPRDVVKGVVEGQG